MSDVQLNVNGVSVGTWKEVEIERSLEAVAGKFSLKCADPAGLAGLAGLAPGTTAALSIDGETVITGFVDGAEVTYDKGSHEVTVTGRDRTGDLVDSSYLPGVSAPNYWTGATPGTIARQILEPFDIPLTIEGGDGPPLPRFAIHVGEKAFAAIDRLARICQLLPTSDGKGGLVFASVGSAGSFAALALGQTNEKATGTVSYAGRFSHYVVLGQTVGSDFMPPQVSAGLRGDAFDGSITRFRPLIIHSEYLG